MLYAEIPNEIRAYKEKLWLGLTVRQLLSSALALVICVPLYLWGKTIISEEIMSWLIMIVALPCGAIGFFRYNGLPFEKFLLTVGKFLICPIKRKLKTDNCFRVWQAEEESEETAKKEKFLNVLKKAREDESLYIASLIRDEHKKGSKVMIPSPKYYIKVKGIEE